MRVTAGKTIWFTGLSGSGKSTLALNLNNILASRGLSVVLLDGDMLRSGLNRDLGFSAEDRTENIRRAGEVAKILTDSGHVVLSAFITPMESIRRAVRNIFDADQFMEIFVECPLEVCESRDPKGLYIKARKGEIANFTGISSPFEDPVASELKVPTYKQTVQESLNFIVNYLDERFEDIRAEYASAPAVLRHNKTKVAVIGLDSVPSNLAFDELADHMPFLSMLRRHGYWGVLESTDPPITVPAWTAITTGRDPGELGLYGFRNRTSRDYGRMTIANASYIKRPRVWEILEQTGKRSVLVGIPQTYPAKPHNGVTVADFLAPGRDSRFTYPAELGAELDKLACGTYMPDVKEFRTEDKDRLLEDIYTMSRRRLSLVSALMTKQDWDFLMAVEIGPDRLHHGFWRFFRKDHRLYEPGNPYESAIPEYYGFLDTYIKELAALFCDNTTVVIVSDHGVRSMVGGIRINQWLMEHGYLILSKTPEGIGQPTPEMIDWSRTSVWSEGGYYARIFINLKDREPNGIIEPADYEQFRDRLADELSNIPDEFGRPMDNQVLKPDAIYHECANIPPDLIVYFDGLNRRSIGSIGHGGIHVAGNDTGPDDANHDKNGIFICCRMSDLRNGTEKNVELTKATYLDVAPTILFEFGLPVPSGLRGSILTLDGVSPDAQRAIPKTQEYERPASVGFTTEEEEIVKKRLMELGYL